MRIGVAGVVGFVAVFVVGFRCSLCHGFFFFGWLGVEVVVGGGGCGHG